MAELTQVLWIGGPAGAGKTTVARQLARRHGLRWYNSDAHTWEHRDRALALGVELPERGTGSQYYDRWPMVIDDLRALPAAPLVVAEGGLVTPSRVRQRGSAVWLMPSRAEQRRRLEQRHPEGPPPAYLGSWEVLDRQVCGAGVHVVAVDGLTVEQTIAEVERFFQPRIAAGPAATTVPERRELARYANRAIVGQRTSPSARPLHPPADPAALRAAFDCECGAAACTATVTVTVGEAARAIQRPTPALRAADH
jgi:shikimate kinase